MGVIIILLYNTRVSYANNDSIRTIFLNLKVKKKDLAKTFNFLFCESETNETLDVINVLPNLQQKKIK